MICSLLSVDCLFSRLLVPRNLLQFTAISFDTLEILFTIPGSGIDSFLINASPLENCVQYLVCCARYAHYWLILRQYSLRSNIIRLASSASNIVTRNKSWLNSLEFFVPQNSRSRQLLFLVPSFRSHSIHSAVRSSQPRSFHAHYTRFPPFQFSLRSRFLSVFPGGCSRSLLFCFPTSYCGIYIHHQHTLFSLKSPFSPEFYTIMRYATTSSAFLLNFSKTNINRHDNTFHFKMARRLTF